ncbi:MAG TPA: 2-dehydro-3-deoxyphosphogluconate aldolase [Lentisphaeria bacterium]|nr:2-dehydro-3-deoxyphosphogluconate aldolase [Lentisphaeria bacterium]
MLSEQLEKIKIVPVLVLNTLDEGLAVCEQLCKNGLPAAEITFRTAAAEPVIREVSKRFPEMYVGAGTVLNITDLHRAFDAGAKFAVAPGFNPKVVAEAVKCNLDFFPAVCTPSEVEQAMEFGCRMLKFFPAEACGGIPMLKSIIAPYKHLGVKFMPTGGVKPVNVESYLQIPEVAAVGGTWLNKCDDETIRQAAAIAAKYIKK